MGETSNTRDLGILIGTWKAEDTLSSRARASTDVPSGELTRTRHVMSNEVDFKQIAVLDDMT